MTTIYSIGHSRHAAEHLVGILRAQEIALLVDVRSHPASKWAPQFGKAALAQTLANHAIESLFLGRELGGRPDGAEYYRSDGAVDYDRRAQAPDFKAGVERLVALARERRTAIMCAAPALKRAGATVVHLRGDGLLELFCAARVQSKAVFARQAANRRHVLRPSLDQCAPNAELPAQLLTLWR